MRTRNAKIGETPRPTRASDTRLALFRLSRERDACQSENVDRTADRKDVKICAGTRLFSSLNIFNVHALFFHVRFSHVKVRNALRIDGIASDIGTFRFRRRFQRLQREIARRAISSSRPTSNVKGPSSSVRDSNASFSKSASRRFRGHSRLNERLESSLLRCVL